MDLHGGAHCCLDIVPLGLRGVEYLHGMGSSRNLGKEDGQTVKMISFCYSRKQKRTEVLIITLYWAVESREVIKSDSHKAAGCSMHLH
jgi:hypothetical protein